MCSARPSLKHGTPACPRKNVYGGTGAESESKDVPKARHNRDLTTADLVLLSLLSERPMHGYQANQELERRQIRDWAAVSRPQVYYSLDKLEKLGLLRARKDSEPAAGPERRVLAATASGRAALARALKRDDWATQRDRPAFLTWMALSWQARSAVIDRQLQRRRSFLESELKRERETLQAVLREVGHVHHEAVWMLNLIIRQFEAELEWLDKVEKSLPNRASAKNPDYATD